MENDRKNHVRQTLVLYITMSLILFLPSCSPPKESVSFPIPPRLVQTTRVRESGEQETHCFSGTAKEGRTVKMSFRVPGPLVEFQVEIGKRVKKGELLARIDPRDYLLAVRQVESELGEANATLSEMKTGARAEDIAAWEAAVVAAQSQFETAKKNEERFARLLAQQSVPQLKYDEIKLLYDQATAALEAARQNLNKGKTGARAEEITAMESKISGLTVQLEKAKNALGDTSLPAPSDGYVSQKYVENGEIVAPGIPVLAFTDASQIKVQTSIPESLLVRRAEFAGFECEFESYPERKFNAELSELGQAQQAGKQGYPLEVEIHTDEGTSIHPGMAATIAVHLKKERAEFLIPLSAIVGDEQIVSDKSETGEKRSASAQSETTFVWKVDPVDDHLIKTIVTIVRMVAEGVIVSGDLKANDRVVSVGARFVREDEKVRVK
ncbi:MAG: efflux RND transporter periplasmic adaptor subunit [Thermoguttaceae bacterium]|nr:efflux RND transporter periplasmic adaptor subunit [Thermoguttaceae bacterium]